MKKLTREWVRKAEADHGAARLCSRAQTPLHDAVCFHAQQCAEKYLKALIQELGIPITRTHDLKALLAELLPHHPSLNRFERGLAALTGYAVDVRYPGKRANKRQATSALRRAENIRTAARELLGI